jgi:hypothetical protein
VRRLALRVHLDADGLEAESEHPWTPAGGDEQAVTVKLASVVDLEDVVLPVASRSTDVGGQDELDALAA